MRIPTGGTTNRNPSIGKYRDLRSGTGPPQKDLTGRVHGKHGGLANAHELGAERDWVESLGIDPPFVFHCK